MIGDAAIRAVDDVAFDIADALRYAPLADDRRGVHRTSARSPVTACSCSLTAVLGAPHARRDRRGLALLAGSR